MADRTTRPIALVLTCEHGGNRIPAPWRALFHDQQARLDSHQGHDIGALACARALARRLDVQLWAAETSRLLIDLNRSPHHPRLFSDITRHLPATDRQRILETCYLPHRQRVTRHIHDLIAAGHRVLHVGVHSFTPVLDGVERNTDLALLYDPARPLEARLCARWRDALRKDGRFRVHSNRPYRGVSDGFTRYLRTCFRPADYAGVELELNQRLLTRPGTAIRSLHDLLASTLEMTTRSRISVINRR